MKIFYTLSLIVLCAGSAFGQTQEITVVAWMRELYSREDHDWGSREEYRCSYSINNQYANPCASAENVDSQQWERFSNNELQTTISVSATSLQMSLTVWEEDGGDGCKVDDGGDSDSNHGIIYYPSLTTLNPRSENNITRVINNSADSRKGYQLAYTIFWFSNTLKTPAFSKGPGREVCFADDLRVETSYHGINSAMSPTYYWEVYDEDARTTTPYSRSDNKLDLRDHIRVNPSSSRNLQVRVATFVRGMQASLEFSEWFDVAINGTPSVTMGSIIQPECAGQKGRVSVSWVSGASDRYNLYLVRDGVTVKQYLDLPAWTGYTFHDIDAGTYTLKVADRTGASCFYEVPNIIIDAAPSALAWRGEKSDYNGFNTSCAGNADGFITLSASGGTGQYVYLHENSEITSFVGKSPGTYAITIRDRTYPSCEITAFETLTAPTSLNVGDISTLPVSCRNSPAPDGLITISSVGGGVGPYQYQLDDGSWLDSNVFPSLAAGRYNVSVKDKNNCVVTLEAEVAQPETNVSSQVIEKSDISCFGGSNGFFVIRGEGGTAFEGGRYKFSVDGGVFSEPGTEQRYEGLTVGTYHVTIQDKNGCIHETDVTIVQPEPITSEQTITSESCTGASDGAAVIVLSQGTGPYFYFDVTSEDTLAVDPVSNTIVVDGLAEGAHSLKVTDS
ncbi:MAG: SprB repeat-containing protein, partial [Chryseosolibacter sp.]